MNHEAQLTITTEGEPDMDTTEQTTTPETTTEDTQAPQDAPTAPEGTDVPDDAPEAPQEAESHPSREAAKYRTRLREAEAQRDALAERVAALQRAEVERIAGATVSNPAALWAADVELDELLTEAGEVDPEKVRAAAVQAAERLGLARPSRNVAPREGDNSRPPGRGGSDDMAAVIGGF